MFLFLYSFKHFFSIDRYLRRSIDVEFDAFPVNRLHLDFNVVADNDRRIGLQLLKHIHGLSDRDVLGRWVENPHWQQFCGEVIFQHRLPMDETTMMRFRHRIGEDGACELLKMSVALGQDTGTIAPESLKVAVIDTTVMPKAVTHPTDAKLAGRCHKQLDI